MDLHLVVVRPFDGLARGDIIADPHRIAAVMASENAQHVIRVHAQQSATAPQGQSPAATATVTREG